MVEAEADALAQKGRAEKALKQEAFDMVIM